MRGTTLYLLLWWAALLAGCSGDAIPTGTTSAGPIPLADVQARGIAGSLGVPLGKIVRIEGVAFDGGTLRSKADQGKTFVAVGVVDGRHFAKPVLLELSIHSLAKETVKPPAHGQAVRLVGWETGGYEGAVHGEFDHVRSYATTGYGFRTEFIAVKSE